MLIEIPFQGYWQEAMLEGRKTATTRTKPYGKTGDTFAAFGVIFRIKTVALIRLGTVAKYHYKEEGCTSPEEFEAIWRRLHPIKGFIGSQEVWIHTFEMVKGEPSHVLVPIL